MLAFALRPVENTAPTVDILVKPVVTFEEAYPRRFLVKAEDVIISVAAAEDLITLKSGTGRDIDKADIRALRRLSELRSRRTDD
jgi:hypothetical protein